MTKTTATTTTTTQQAATPISSVKAGAKRKFGDENENAGATKMQADRGQDKAASNGSYGLQERRSIKDTPASRRQKTAASNKAPAPETRTPLAVKSTNEDVCSPRKILKPKVPGSDANKATKKLEAAAAAKELLLSSRDKAATNGTKPRAITPTMEIPSLPPPQQPVVAMIIEEPEPEPQCLPSPPRPTTPDTPERPAANKNTKPDTPPPAGIDANGEIPRPGRRARASISYAEPSLRVKMRRPTKELVDAVAGEGKFNNRPATQKNEDGTALLPSATKIKSEPGSIESLKTLPIREDSLHQQHPQSREVTMSPLAQKESSLVMADGLPSTVSMERRRRPSAAAGSEAQPGVVDERDGGRRDSSSSASPPAAKSRGLNRTHAQHQQEKADIYDFSCSSPLSPETSQDNTPAATASSSANGRAACGGRPRGARRASSNTHQQQQQQQQQQQINQQGDAMSGIVTTTTTEVTAAVSAKSRSAHPRKRASMQMSRKKSSLAAAAAAAVGAAGEGAPSDGAGDEADTERETGRMDKITRRRSMML